MIDNQNKSFFEELELRRNLVDEYILQPRFTSRFRPDDISSAVTAYVRYGGKRLRPAILMLSCGAVGGDENIAIPAAAAVEIFHTRTLVHDDIIDRDSIRRGSPTLHILYADRTEKGESGFQLEHDLARHYGISVAILSGDVQHGWGICMMSELSTKNGIDANLTLELINQLDTNVLNTLVEGEVLDIQYSFKNIEDLTPDLIEDMLWKKTGALLEFCGQAGAIIGVGKSDHPLVRAMAKFAAKCGTAFQLQDDILGIVGNQKTLGKPIGSDLREGKRTLVLYYAYRNCNTVERKKLLSVLGNDHANEADVKECIGLLREKNGISTVKERSQRLIEQALVHLNMLPASRYKVLLAQWADFMINRDF